LSRVRKSGAGIELEHLNVWFGEDEDRVNAVIDAGFSVPMGGSFGLVGESGSGKSTVLRAITGLAPTWSGKISVLGNELSETRDKEFFSSVQMVFQDPYASLHPRQTVDHVLSEALYLHGFDEPDKRIGRERVKELLATGADTVAVACPFCLIMVKDGVADEDPNVEVRDVAEILADRLVAPTNGG